MHLPERGAGCSVRPLCNAVRKFSIPSLIVDILSYLFDGVLHSKVRVPAVSLPVRVAVVGVVLMHGGTALQHALPIRLKVTANVSRIAQVSVLYINIIIMIKKKKEGAE